MKPMSVGRVQLGSATPLNQQDLEDSLRLLQLDSLLESVDAELISGTGAGQSILRLEVAEAPAFSATVSTNNYRPAECWHRSGCGRSSS